MKDRIWLHWLILVMALPLGVGVFCLLGGLEASDRLKTLVFLVTLVVVAAYVDWWCRKDELRSLRLQPRKPKAEPYFRVAFVASYPADDLWEYRPHHAEEPGV